MYLDSHIPLVDFPHVESHGGDHVLVKLARLKDRDKILRISYAR